MPLGRKHSAFRKTVSDLKSAAGLLGNNNSNNNSGGGGGNSVASRGRKRKLSEPGSDEAAAAPPVAPVPAAATRGATSALPRMGRSLANLASSIKKQRRNLANKRPKVSQPDENNDHDQAEEEDAEDDEDDTGHESTIFEDVPSPANKAAGKSQKHQQKQPQQKQQQQQQQAPTKKERRALKKKQKKNADLVSELLTLWEELRIEATPAGRVAELCGAALKLGRGKLAELAASHDTGRVLEAVLKRGSEQQRWLLFEELKDHVLPLAKSKYGRFVALKLLRYGAKEHRAFVLRSLEGRAPELLKHRFASELVEAAYNEFANAGQRASILQEFYGPELALFKSSSVCRLKDALEKRPGLVMQHLQQHLLALTQKDLVRHSLVQHLLLEYLEEALAPGPSDAAAALLENLRDNLVPMLHTRDGAKAALLIVRHLSGKDLKRALKSMKTFLCTAACNEHGYLFVIGLTECTSGLLSAEELHKLLLRELFDSLQELVDSQYGRKVLLYLLSPRDPLHFPPQLMSLIKPATEAVPTEQLRQRLHQSLAACSAKLLSHVSGRMAELCRANATILFVMDTLRHCPGEKSACYAALADLIRQPFVPSSLSDNSQQQQQHSASSTSASVDESKQHIIERSAGHLMLKRLLPGHPDLVRLINDFVADEDITSWLVCNRGSFFLLQLYENCPEDCNLRQRIASLVQPPLLRQSAHKGAQLLAEKLQQQHQSSAVAATAAATPKSQEAKKARRLSKK